MGQVGRRGFVPLLALAALVLAGCPAQPEEAVAFSTADYAKGVETALVNLEKTPPADRREAKESLDELMERHATPEQQARYAKLLAGG